MKTFFIAGAPRSGTGWLSAFLTTEDSVCLHEGLKFIGQNKYNPLFDALGKEVCGDAGAHISFQHREILAEFPKAKTVLIHRPSQEGIPAAVKIGISADLCQSCYNSLEKLEKNVSLFKISFKDVFTEKGSEAICNHVGVKFDRTRFNIFRRLNIQATPETHHETIQYVKTGVERPFHKV